MSLKGITGNDDEVTWRNKMCQLYRTVSESIMDHSYTRKEEGGQFQEQLSFLASTVRDVNVMWMITVI